MKSQKQKQFNRKTYKCFKTKNISNFGEKWSPSGQPFVFPILTEEVSLHSILQSMSSVLCL